MKMIQVLFALEIDADHVLQRTRDEKILLLQSQLLPYRRFIIRVKHLGDVFRGNLFIDRPVVVADVERMKIKRFTSFGLPEAKKIGGIDVITKKRGIVGNALDHPIGSPAHPKIALYVESGFGISTQLYVKSNLGTGYFPGIAQLQPLIGHFDLPSITNLLVKNAKFIPNPITDGGDLQSGQGIHIT